jgi:hypothetical protein
MKVSHLLEQSSNPRSQFRVNEFFKELNSKLDIMTRGERKWFDQAMSRYEAAGDIHTDERLDIFDDMEHRLNRI